MNWLRQRREEVGIETQDDLAALLQLEGYGVTRATVSHWENGRNQPPLKESVARISLARVLKLSEHELLRRAGYNVDSEFSEAGERAAHIVDSLAPDQQKLALRLLEQLLPE
ncbi:MAG: helix-turn-helix domain-containing protein [Anaerolineae bacterium]|nr:helix-turn-helix domain-containing protein [Anaerolineae bacterium]NUQ07170.1 helix-turn-helix transcriptional regulator [Anaerolineae bacterium]